MELKDFQKQVSELIEKIDVKNSGKHDVDTTIIHIIEELGEVARQLYNQKIGRDELDKENLAEEISDCIILLSHLAHKFDIDIEESIKNKLQKIKERFDV